MKTKISLYYFLSYFALGSIYPFLSLYLKETGLSGAEVGTLLAASAAAGILAQPLLGALNDRARDHRTILALSTLCSPIASFGYLLHLGWVWLLFVSVVCSIAQSAAGPLFDAIAVQNGERFGFTYGQVRLWGALGYAISTLAVGYADDRWGFQWGFYAFAGATWLSMWVILRLPKSGPPALRREPMLSSIWSVAGNRRFIIFVTACFLASAAAAMNFGYFSIYFRDLGYPMQWLGLNFTIAAVIEVPFFFASSRLTERIGLFPVLTIGAVSYAAKFALLTTSPAAPLVFASQLLDGIGFAFYMSAAVQVVNNLSPDGAKATGQTVFGAIASGLSNIAGSGMGGIILDHFGPRAVFGVMTGLALAGGAVFFLFPRLARGVREQADTGANGMEA